MKNINLKDEKFSIDLNDFNRMNRRTFIKMAGIAVGTIAFGGSFLRNIPSAAASASATEASVYSTGVYPGNSFIDPTAHINVNTFSIGSESYIAPFTSFSGESANVGSYSNIQDGSTNSGKIKIADNAVIAHGADMNGDVEIGSRAFIGFNSLITDSKIGDGAYINVRSIINGVDIPAGLSVPAGSVIESQNDIQKLKKATIAQRVFVADVIGVNRALAVGYSQLYEKKGMDAFGKIGPNGNGDIMVDGRAILGYSGSHEPLVGTGASIDNVRIIGNVTIGDNVKIEDGTTIRGDEGVPISIGDNARIGKDNTFHSLNKKIILIGKDFRLSSDAVIHGPLEIGDNVRVGSRSIVFKSKIGDNVVIGDNAIVSGVRLLDGAVIPSDTIVGNQKDAEKFNDAVRKDDSKEPASLFGYAFSAFIPAALGLGGSVALKDRHN